MMFGRRHDPRQQQQQQALSSIPPPPSPSKRRGLFFPRNSPKNMISPAPQEEKPEEEEEKKDETEQTMDISNITAMNNNEPWSRRRLDSQETLLMSNLNLPELMLDDSNPFLECHEHYTPEAVRRAAAVRQRREEEEEAAAAAAAEEEEEAAAVVEEEEEVVDCASELSSLSSGSFKQRPPPPPSPSEQQLEAMRMTTPRSAVPATDQREGRHFVAPKMIIFRVQSKVPDWLEVDDDDEEEEGQECPANDSLVTADTMDDNTAENHHSQQQLVSPPQLQYRHSPRVHCAQQQHQSPVPSLTRPVVPAMAFHAIRHPALQQQQQKQQPCMPSPVWTGMPSPANPRPTMGRHKSVSCAALFPARAITTPGQSLSTPNTAATGTVGVTMEGVFPPPSPCGTLLSKSSHVYCQQQQQTNLRPRRTPLPPAPALLLVPPMTPNSYTPTTPATIKKCCSSGKGQHSPISSKRQQHSPRGHRRIKSVGQESLLGHDSLWTAPTAASSLEATHSHCLDQEQLPSTAHAKRKSAMVQELRSMWCKVVARPAAATATATLEEHAPTEEWRLNTAHKGCFT